MALIMLMFNLGEVAKKGSSSRRFTGGDDENCFASDCDNLDSDGCTGSLEYSPTLQLEMNEDSAVKSTRINRGKRRPLKNLIHHGESRRRLRCCCARFLDFAQHKFRIRLRFLNKRLS